MITIEQLKAVQDRLTDLHRYLNIEDKKIQLEEEELRTQVPGFWDNQKEAEKQMKVVKGIRSWIDAYNNVKANVDELATAFEFYKEELVSEEEVDAQYKKTIDLFEDVELKNMLQGEEDHMNCILKINAGAGGTEAQDWAEQLQRLYMRYAEDHGYKATVQDLVEGDDAGIKSVTIEIDGDYAFGYLKSENGVHRLVRVSPYNAQGKRMTSFASVFAFPLIDDTIEIKIDPGKLTWDTFRSGGAGGQNVDTFRSGGAGGQNVNKVESGVRARYMYTDPYTGEEKELLQACTVTRDQPKNREMALELLKSQIYNIELEHKREKQASIEAGKKKIEWGSQIRSYVFDDRRVKDHRTGYQTSDVNAVMDGKIDGFIKAYLMEFGDK